MSEGNYTVDNEKGLKNLAKLVNEEWKSDINITLTGDITLTGEWTPIGTYDNPYTGTFDGGGHTITGLTVTTSDQYAGLFGDIDENGTVKNVVLEDVQITSDNSSGYAGGVAGDSWGTIENCSVSGSVSGTTFAGGVVGSQWGGSITGCNSSATVKGVIFAGGIAGETNSGASLTGCYATGDVTVENDGTNNSHAGGVVGCHGQRDRYRHWNRLLLCRRRNGRQCFGHPDRLLSRYGRCHWSLRKHRRRGGTELQGLHV